MTRFTLQHTRAWGLVVVGEPSDMNRKDYCSRALIEADRQYRLWYSADGWPGSTRPDYVERSADVVMWRPVPLHEQPTHVLTDGSVSVSVYAEDSCGDSCDPQRAKFCRLRTREEVDGRAESQYAVQGSRLYRDGFIVETPWTLESLDREAES